MNQFGDSNITSNYFDDILERLSKVVGNRLVLDSDRHVPIVWSLYLRTAIVKRENRAWVVKTQTA